MLSISPSTVMIHGKEYKLKPYSPVNWKALQDIAPQLIEQMESGKITQFDYWDRLLRVVLVGPYEWDVHAPDFDGREAENGILAFVPPSMQFNVLLTGFQPY